MRFGFPFKRGEWLPNDRIPVHGNAEQMGWGA